jgi:hypothetical protein
LNINNDNISNNYITNQAQRLAAQALGRLCNTWFILPETSSKHVALPLAALPQLSILFDTTPPPKLVYKEEKPK